MACLGCLRCFFFKCFGIFIMYCYPGYKVIQTAQKKDFQKIWVIYFFMLGLFSLFEKTILFPLIILLGKISRKIFPTLKVLFHLWLYYPEYRGALFLEQKLGGLLDKIFQRTNPLVGKLLSYLGIKNKDSEAMMKRNQ